MVLGDRCGEGMGWDIGRWGWVGMSARKYKGVWGREWVGE